MKNIVKGKSEDLAVKTHNESGITLVALVITIIVLMIIATIAIREGTQIIREAKVQTLETNMLAIKAKAKTYMEEVEAATWSLSDENKVITRKNFLTGEVDENGYKMVEETISENEREQLSEELKTATIEAYSITEETLVKMRLEEAIEDIKNGKKYIIVYDVNNLNSIDIIYTVGINYKGNIYYTLSALQAAHDGE